MLKRHVCCGFVGKVLMLVIMCASGTVSMFRLASHKVKCHRPIGQKRKAAAVRELSCS